MKINGTFLYNGYRITDVEKIGDKYFFHNIIADGSPGKMEHVISQKEWESSVQEVSADCGD